MKLWAYNGNGILLQLLGEERKGAAASPLSLTPLAPSTPASNHQDAQMQVGLLRALDTWLAEDHTRVEHRLISPQVRGGRGPPRASPGSCLLCMRSSAPRLCCLAFGMLDGACVPQASCCADCIVLSPGPQFVGAGR